MDRKLFAADEDTDFPVEGYDEKNLVVADERDHISNNKQMVPGLDVYLPFTLASDNEQLEQDIMAFDQSAYDKKLDEFHEKMGLVFDGRASEKIIENIAPCNIRR